MKIPFFLYIAEGENIKQIKNYTSDKSVLNTKGKWYMMNKK